MKKPSELGGRREGSMEWLQVRGYVLVSGSSDFFPGLELMM